MTATWNETTAGDPPPGFTGRVDYLTRNNKTSHYYLLDGERLDGVTTILDKGIAKQAFLTGWAARVVAEEAFRSRGYWKMLPEDEAVKFLKGAQYRTKTDAGAKGTEVHAWAEHYAAHGVMPDLGDVDPVIRGQVSALGKFFADFQVRIIHSEIVVFNRAELYSGTLDLIAVITLADGTKVIALLDFKTSKSVYSEVGLQLAAYRYADFFIDDNGNRVGMPSVDFTGVVWLPAIHPTKRMTANGGYELVPVQADRACYRTFLQAKAMARFNDKGASVIGKPLAIPEGMAPVPVAAATDPFVGLP